MVRFVVGVLEFVAFSRRFTHGVRAFHSKLRLVSKVPVTRRKAAGVSSWDYSIRRVIPSGDDGS